MCYRASKICVSFIGNTGRTQWKKTVTCIVYHIERNFKRENFHEFWRFVAIHKVLSTKLGALHLLVAQLWYQQTLWKFSLRKSIFHQFAKDFSLKSFPLCGSTWSDDMLFDIWDQISPDRGIPNMAALTIPVVWWALLICEATFNTHKRK